MTKNLGFVGALAIAFASACGGGSDSDNKCGDGELGGNEQCDDGNTADGDGCSASCRTETDSTCGDGTIDVNNGEQCDDGNLDNGDGCSSSCANESPMNCGNGHIDVGETCDDSNQVSGDGCSSFCQLEEGGGSGSCAAPLPITLVTGTNGTQTATITGNTTSGMDHFPIATCGSVVGRGDGFDLQYKLVVAEKSNVVIRAASGTTPDLMLRLSTTACDATTTVMNGCTDEPETLNLTNLAAGTYYLDVDGYDNTEYGPFNISVQVKPSLCGNGTVDPGEGCDDSNNTSGDGCSSTCHDETAGGCANPEELNFSDTDSDGNPIAIVMGNTSTGTNEFAAGACEDDTDIGGAKDVTYSFELTETSDVRTDLTTSISWGGIIRLTTAGCDINTEVVLDPDTGSGCSESPYSYNYWSGLPAGTYYITMDGKTPTSTGAFNLRVRTITPTLCGNGEDDDGEDCDDGNDVDGDGCSSRCLVEDGFVCDFEEPTTCMIDVCGNGMIDSGEQCDDGARMNGDGCSRTCQLESGYACTGAPSVCALKCGNGHVDAGETCDDGDRDSADGCSSTCQLEAGYTCSGTPSVCMTRCGNGQIDTGEMCDDGNATASDGCSATCQLESGYVCSGLPSVCVTKCGNGIIDSGEQCDDGDHDAGDGCSATCQREPGYTCVGFPSMCTTKCGNNVLDAGETCDDGNAMAGDGCSNICKIEDQYTCTTTLPSVCTPDPAVCGDAVVQIGETCDDSNTTGGDGCSATCLLENGVSEMEPNDAAAQMLTAGNHFIKGSFSATDDVDLYTFTLTAPAMMTAEVFTSFDPTHTYGGATGGNTNVDCIDPSLDTRLALYSGTDTNGTSVSTDDDSGDDDCSMLLNVSLAAGTYTLKVYEWSFSDPGIYYVDLHFN